MQGLFPKLNAYFLVAGKSEGFTPLNAFDGALLDAGVGNTNLIKLSSILPPGSKKIEPLQLPQGDMIPIAYASKSSDIPGQIISSAVAIGIPEDDSQAGVIMEYSVGGRKDTAETIVRSMAEEALKQRGLKIKRIESISAEHTIERIGATFAGVVLWQNT
jgi:arginine decarboxylase